MGVMRGVTALALLGFFPSLAAAKPIVEKLGEITVDFTHRTIEAKGAAAVSLSAPSAEVGRVGAERNARLDAAKRIRRALDKLSDERRGCKGDIPTLEAALTAAQPSAIDWESDGSVRLTLKLSYSELDTLPPPTVKAALPVAIVLAPTPKPALFASDGNDCGKMRAAPPLFATVTDARGELPAVKDAPAVKKLGDGVWAAAVARSEK
jgi:hypothetical protein